MTVISSLFTVWIVLLNDGKTNHNIANLLWCVAEDSMCYIIQFNYEIVLKMISNIIFNVVAYSNTLFNMKNDKIDELSYFEKGKQRVMSHLAVKCIAFGEKHLSRAVERTSPLLLGWGGRPIPKHWEWIDIVYLLCIFISLFVD